MLLSFHERFDLLDSYWYVLHQIFIAISRYPDIIFNSYAHFLLFNVNTRLYGEYHSRSYWFSPRAQVVNINPKVM